MELRTIGELVWRPRSSPLISLLSTSARNSTPQHPMLSRTARPFICHSCRHFSQIISIRQQAAAKKSPSEEWESIDDKQTSPPRPSTLDSEDQDLLNEAMDFSHTPGAAAKHKPRFKSPSAQAGRRLEYSPEQLGGSSFDDALSAFSSRPKWAEPRSLNRGTATPSQLAKSLIFPTPQSPGGFQYGNSAIPKTDLVSQGRKLQELNIHLSARTGRTVEVDNNNPMSLGSKMRQLEMLVGRNRIRAEFNKQKFHERGGLKRKRLASQRWRRRFKAGFARTVTRVQELRRKGW